MTPTTPLLLLSAALSLAAASASAQFPVHTFRGDDAGDGLGFALGDAGDVDGDGQGDLIIGAPRNDAGGLNSGSAYVHSGGSWVELHRFDGAPGDNLGWSVAGAGDVDADGRGDLILGAPSAGQGTGALLRGQARVYSGQSGVLLYVFDGAVQFDRFGSAVDGAGDVDGDGRDDVVIGAPLEDGNGIDSGVVHLRSGLDGHLIHLLSGDQQGDQLGTSVAGLGDLDLDGFDDFAAGAPYADAGGQDAGMVRVYSGRNGAVLFTRLGPAEGAELGRSVAGLGDINFDGRPDVAAGAWRDPSGGPGAGSVIVLSGANGSVLRVLTGPPGSALGAAVAGAGDVDGDGVRDLVAGAPEEAGGTARVFSGSDGSVLHLVTARAPGDRLGSAVAGGFDADGDGRIEYAAGAWLADGPATDAGLATVYSDVDPLGRAYCFGDGSGTTCPCGNSGAPAEGCEHSGGVGGLLQGAGSPSVSADDLVLTALQLVPGQPALLFAGVNAVNGGSGLPFGDGLRCAGGSVVRLGVHVPDAAGTAVYGPGLAALGGFASGELRRFQTWFRDPVGGPCGSGFNLTPGYELAFTR